MPSDENLAVVNSLLFLGRSSMVNVNMINTLLFVDICAFES